MNKMDHCVLNLLAFFLFRFFFPLVVLQIRIRSTLGISLRRPGRAVGKRGRTPFNFRCE